MSPWPSADLRSELDRNSLSYTELIATLVLVAGSTIFVCGMRAIVCGTLAGLHATDEGGAGTDRSHSGVTVPAWRWTKSIRCPHR